MYVQDLVKHTRVAEVLDREGCPPFLQMTMYYVTAMETGACNIDEVTQYICEHQHEWCSASNGVIINIYTALEETP